MTIHDSGDVGTFSPTSVASIPISKVTSRTSRTNKSNAASSKPERMTRERLEVWLKDSVIETASTAKPGVFEFAGDPTSGCVVETGGTGDMVDTRQGRGVVVRRCSPLSLIGPTVVIDSLSKEGSSKKEDKWLLKANNRWCIPSIDGRGLEGGPGEVGGVHGGSVTSSPTAKVGVWGVFDGHGGKQAATYASHALYKYTSEYVCAAQDADRESLNVGELRLPEEEGGDTSYMCSPGFFRQMNKPHNVDTFALQVEYMKRLPSAVHKAFLRTDEQARKQFQQGGGTTATVAFLCGWQLLVASVGDSQAFLDTGSEVLSVSANHRLEDNELERARIEAEGGEVAASTVNGKPAGPLRVWPGGLAMSRTIGDVDAGMLCVADADVVQVTVPKDGARLIIGSDGLWDAVHPKTAAHHTREMTASEASHKLLSMAIKKDHLKDDVTVVVVDIVPPGHEEGKVVPGLRLHSPAKGQKGSQVEPRHLARVWRPLKDAGCVKWVEEELMRRVDEYERWRRQEEERDLLAKRQKEMLKEEARSKVMRDENTMRRGVTEGNGGKLPLASYAGDHGPGDRKKKNSMRKRGSRKSLLDELTNLTLDVDEEWTTVGGHGKNNPEKESEKARTKTTSRTKKKPRPKKKPNTTSGNVDGSNHSEKPVGDLGTGPSTGAATSTGSARANSDSQKKKRPPRNRKKTRAPGAAPRTSD